MKETKTLDEVLNEVVSNVVGEILKTDTGDKEYDIDIVVDDGNECDDGDNNLLDKMYTQLEFMMEIASLMADMAEGIAKECTNTLAEISGNDVEE